MGRNDKNMRAPIGRKLRIKCETSPRAPAVKYQFDEAASISIQMESDLHADLNVDRLSIFQRGLKTPLFDRFNRARVQSVA